MYTSDIKKAAFIHLLFGVFLWIFGRVYEHFAFGEYSYFMRYMFLIPIAAGTGAILLYRIVSGRKRMDRVMFLLWNSAIGILVSGCLIKGIIEMSGRNTELEGYYWVGGAVFGLLASMRGLWCKTGQGKASLEE